MPRFLSCPNYFCTPAQLLESTRLQYLPQQWSPDAQGHQESGQGTESNSMKQLVLSLTYPKKGSPGERTECLKLSQAASWTPSKAGIPNPLPKILTSHIQWLPNQRKMPYLGGQNNCTEGRTFALQASNQSSIPSTPYFPTSLPGVILECRTRNNPSALRYAPN